ncbi:MAG: hypothetical protein R3C26_11030 [Calditrichia bacterium]
MNPTNAYIIDGIRTPIGKFGGSLSTVERMILAALTIAELVKRNPQIDPELIDDVILAVPIRRAKITAMLGADGATARRIAAHRSRRNR